MLDQDDEDDGPLSIDPEEQWGNPEEDLVDVPEVEPPRVRNPADGLPEFSSVDSRVSGPFVLAALYANVALFCVSLGLMLVGFDGEWRWGGALILVGAFAAVRVYQTYRKFENNRPDGDDPDGEVSPDGDDPRTTD